MNIPMISLKQASRIVLGAIVAASTLSFTSCTDPSQSSRSSNSYNRTVYKPLVTIRNNSYRQITIGLQGPEKRFVTIPARSSRSVNLLSGNYAYAAAAPNTRTISGYKYFGTDRQYTWNFNVN